jgi:tRNA1Val (adenine37-N6)-methyltransferase
MVSFRGVTADHCNADMSNNYFSFKQFTIHQDKCSLRVSTDSCILGAWFAAKQINTSTTLDIGSGTGLLMLMLAQKKPGMIDGIEIDQSCFQQLVENISKSPWHNRCTAFEGDAKTYPFQREYDLVISNPPFYEGHLETDDPKINLAKHSSHLSLSELFQTAERNLTREGMLGILLPWFRIQEAVEQGASHGLYCTEKLLVKQTPGHEFFRGILQFERNAIAEPDIYEMTIQESPGKYSDMFIDLLKDYYLKL